MEYIKVQITKNNIHKMKSVGSFAKIINILISENDKQSLKKKLKAYDDNNQ